MAKSKKKPTLQQLGGMATLAKRGVAHYRRMAKLSWKARRAAAK